MRFPGLTGLVMCLASISSWASPAQSQTVADARQFLASKDYSLHNNTAITYDDLLVKKARILIRQGQYKAALKVLDELDTLDGFDAARINYVPDMAIVALAADNMAQYDYFRALALDAVKISTAKSVCKQDPYYHLKSDEDITLERREDITIRVCSSSLTVNKPVSLNADFEVKMAFLGGASVGPRPYIATAPASEPALAPTEPQIMVMSVTLDPATVSAPATGNLVSETAAPATAVALPAAPLPYTTLYAPVDTAVATPTPSPKRKTEWVMPAKDGEAEKPYRPRRK